MKPRLGLILLFLFPLSQGSGLAGVEPDKLTQAFHLVEAYAKQTQDWSGTPGISIALTSSEKTLYSDTFGFADRKLGKRLAETTLLQIGSITKSFTAVALLALAEEGKLDLDAPITEELPWFSIKTEYPEITPRHLLTNTSGIPANRDDLPSSPYMAVAIREQEAAWAPGTRLHYSNVGYQLLSVLVESVAGKPWADVIDERIIGPLGMTNSEPGISYATRSRQAIGYIQADAERPAHRTRELAEAPHFPYAMGDGCISSTAEDMAIFVRLLLNRGHVGETRILSENAFKDFIDPGIPNENGGGYACGIGVDRREGRFILHHFGGMVGFTAYAMADMETGFGVVVLCNGPGQPYRIARYAIEVMNALSRDLPLPEIPENRNPSKVDNAADYADSFTSPDGETIQVEARGDELWIRLEDSLAQLEHVWSDTFYTLHPDLDRYYLKFERDDQGQVIYVTHGPRWLANQHYTGPTEFTPPKDWQAYVGTYHSHSPWFPGFSVFIRRGELWSVTAGGGETSAGQEARLFQVEKGIFRPEAEPTPERVAFDEVVSGKAMRASWSGHTFYRAHLHE
ncbi:MAG: serine hydrolase domain-containing protein [Puniceicoccaceae bacterium]